MPLYRNMDRAALDAAYHNRNAVAAYPAIAAARKALSERVRAERRLHADLRYGAGARERLDFFPAARAGAPVLAFLHGGYWQSNDKEASSYLVEGPLAHGVAVALVEYTLAPEADIDQIVAEVRRAVDWLGANVAGLGGDPERIVVAGNSAGGHLTAMAMGQPRVAGAIAISGLYDLEPIRLNYLNEKLRLTEDAARRNSPVLHVPASIPPLVVSVGAAELPELVRQSAEYAAALAAKGLPVEYLALAGHDHFSIMDELARPEGVLCRKLLALLGEKAPA